MAPSTGVKKLWGALGAMSALLPKGDIAAAIRMSTSGHKAYYTIPIHAERRGLHHVLIEIRQDLIADESGRRAWALRLALTISLAVW
jgi:hypothetical protein